MTPKISPVSMAISCVLGLWVASPTAHASLITSQGPVAFSESVSVTDTKASSGSTSNNNALFGTTTFNTFNPDLGVLTGATVTLTSTRTPSISGGRVSTTTGTATGSGSSTPKLVLPSGETTFTSTSLSGNCGQTGVNCPYSSSGATTNINSVLNITNPATLGNYVAAGGSFNVERRAASLSVTSAGGASNTTATYTSTWIGSLQLDYTYLLHANPSFDGSLDLDTLTLDFGTVLQGSSVSPLDFLLFNLGDANTVGLDLDSISSVGDDSLLTTDLASLLNLDAGSVGQSFHAFFDTLNTGDFMATYTLGFSDSNVGAEATRRSYQMVLNLKGTVAAPTQSVPEPATWALLALGLMGLGFMRRQAVR